MAQLPALSEPTQSRVTTSAFLGYNHNLQIAQNQWHEMENITGDQYPLMAQRAQRGTVATLLSPHGLSVKDAPIWSAGTSLYINGVAVAGLTLTDSGPKQLVSMGAYLVIFPDKKYVNTADLSDYGSLDASYASTGSVSYSLCDEKGTGYGTCTTAAAAPASPDNGALWIDTSVTPHVLRKYSTSSAQWVSMPTTYIRISCTGIGAAFKAGDGVTISGAAGTDQVAELNQTCVLQARDADWIVVIGILDQAITQSTGTVTVSRTAPDMDYVCEAQNRLWGCKYGIVGGKSVNELYCCKLGDFRNWNVFSGISTDSWAASVGSDGVFTGAVNYLGYPTFFKEGRLHRIAVSSSGAHQVTETICRGVQRGSWQSLRVVGETLYYKAPEAIMAYTGSLPSALSDVFGGVKYSAAVAGSVGRKYYISMMDESSDWSLFSYDADKSIWMREDATHALAWAADGDELYYIDAADNALKTVYGSRGMKEAAVSWQAVSGIQYYDLPDHKYLGRYNLRMQLGAGATCSLAIQYDSDGVWRDGGAITGAGIGVFTLPVIPRRCDHLQLRLSGSGEIRLFAITRILEQGSDR